MRIGWGRTAPLTRRKVDVSNDRIMFVNLYHKYIKALATRPDFRRRKCRCVQVHFSKTKVITTVGGSNLLGEISQFPLYTVSQKLCKIVFA